MLSQSEKHVKIVNTAFIIPVMFLQFLSARFILEAAALAIFGIFCATGGRDPLLLFFSCATFDGEALLTGAKLEASMMSSFVVYKVPY